MKPLKSSNKMKTTIKFILFLAALALTACEKSEDDFSAKDSYLYVWNVRTWEVGKESKLSDIKVTYFFKGDTARVQQINFWVIKENSTLYAEDALKQMDKAFQVNTLQKDPNQKEFKNQCSFRFDESVTADFDGDPIVAGGKYRLVVKAIATDDMVVDSPTVESGVFEIYDPSQPQE